MANGGRKELVVEVFFVYPGHFHDVSYELTTEEVVYQ